MDGLYFHFWPRETDVPIATLEQRKKKKRQGLSANVTSGIGLIMDVFKSKKKKAMVLSVFAVCVLVKFDIGGDGTKTTSVRRRCTDLN